ncbi:MAG: glycoside hydrolase family 97 protein [Muribaculaceae bacterium]|nr:glycoside hydrolase family 97 protein [Muribaculaceae bacterium]
MKRLTLIVSLLTLSAVAQARSFTVTSPDKAVVATVNVDSVISWKVDVDGKEVLAPSAMSMTVESGISPGIKPKVKKSTSTSVDRTITPAVYKRAKVHDHYNQLTLDMGGYSLEVRAYDDGAAYRFVTAGKKPVTVTGERVEFNFPDDYPAYIPYVNDNRSGERYTYSFESYYDRSKIGEMYADSLAITPLLVDAGDVKIAVSDFGGVDYPGMFLKRNPDKAAALVAEFAPVPLKGEMGGYNYLNFIPTERAGYIARDLPGSFEYPWRAIVISRDDASLADTDMAVRLGQPSRIAETSWIKPGKVAWDWWNNLHVTGVDFKVGRNTETYKHFIDFAKEYGIEYIIVDEGWSDPNSILTAVGEIDIPALVAYGKDKGVGVILWASWKNVHKELDEAMKHYADMGVAGFKIDFFDADDQNMMRDMERFAKAAADNKMIVDYHGMKANGLQTIYPNILNFEGVKGLENYKWSSIENDPPRYAVTAPFIRTITGPMDYTPGAMTNVNESQHRANNDNPMSESTRAHQLAMYVVYDAPLQMLADSPTRYRANPECTKMISLVPTVFDESVTLDGEVGEYIVTARRKGDTWYVGAMTNRTPRVVKIPLSFLGDGDFTMTYVADGINTDIDASDHKHVSASVNSSTTATADMAPAGGWMAIITPQR